MTRCPLMDRNIAFACGEQVGNKNARANGRISWSEEDTEKAARTTLRLLLDVPLEEGGLKGVALSSEDRAYLGFDP